MRLEGGGVSEEVPVMEVAVLMLQLSTWIGRKCTQNEGIITWKLEADYIKAIILVLSLD